MTAGRFSSPLAEELAPAALERFLRYVRVDTQSDPDSETFPSTEKQLDLTRMLADELRALGLTDAHVTDHGYAIATLPGADDAPTICFTAHVDTSSSVSGAGVDPQVHRAWDGSAIALPRDPTQVLSVEELPELADHAGCDLVTTDGTTLLGADDKAGVAEIMAAVEYLLAHPELRHAPVKIVFTPDEEVGRGTDYLDHDALGAVAAYTLDGSTAGEIQDETFSGSAVTVTFKGVEVHPGFAKDTLVNSVKIAGEFLARLPKDSLSPETTEDRDGFVHATRITGTPDSTTVSFIARDFDEDKLRAHETLLRELAEEVAAEHPRSSVEVSVRQQYRNMGYFLGDHPLVVAAAEEAVRRSGHEPRRTSIRGGTDGSRLSEKGLPTPNIFTGGHEFHSTREWICVQDMGAAAATLVHLAQLWAEPPHPRG